MTLVGILSQSAILFVLVFAITRLAPRMPAQIQSFLWLLFFAHLAIAPFYTYTLHILPAPAPTASLTLIPVHSNYSPSISAPLPGRSSVPWLAILWVCGSTTLFALGLSQYIKVLRRLKSARLAPSTVRAELAQIASNMGLNATIHLRILAEGAPCAIGLFRPVILIPEALLADAETDHRLAVLTHEVTHIKNRDAYTSLALAVVRAIYFFFPCVWFAFREWTATREYICDDAVLDHLPMSPARYCRTLFDLGDQPRISSLAQTFSNDFHQLQRRIKHMDNRNKNRGAASVAAIAALIVVGLATVPISLASQIRPTGNSIQPGTVSDQAAPMPADNLLETPVTLDLKQTKLSDVAQALGKSVNFKIISHTRRTGLQVSLSAKEAPLKEVLDTICNSSGLKWARYKDHIEITDK